jgi:hypothetical protein
VRTAGFAVAVLASAWLSSGLVLAGSDPLEIDAAKRRENRELLQPTPGVLSLGSALERSRLAGGSAAVAQARLVRQAGHPVWLVQEVDGTRVSLSALDGQVRQVDAEAALEIAARWVAHGEEFDEPVGDDSVLRYLGERASPGATDVQAFSPPFHRVAVGSRGRELLVSAATGEVVHDSTRALRAAQAVWTLGGWWSGHALAADDAPEEPQTLAGQREAPATLSVAPAERVQENDMEVVELVWQPVGPRGALVVLTRETSVDDGI